MVTFKSCRFGIADYKVLFWGKIAVSAISSKSSWLPTFGVTDFNISCGGYTLPLKFEF